MAATAASPSSAPWADFRLGSIPDPAATPLPYLLTAFLVAVALFTFGSKSGSNTAITHLNPRKPLEFSDSKAKARFAFNAREFIISWFRANPDKPARVIADWGVVTLLPARFINEIRNHPDLSFSKAIFNAFHAHLPGFEGFREGSRDSNIVQKVIMKDLTKYLNKVTEPLSEETALALEDLYPGSPNNDWTPVPLRASLLRLVARISSRVFLGDELCRNEEWLKVTREYTIDAMRAAEELRMWPYPTRFIAHWFLPSCRRARAHTKEARRIITPIIEKRRQQRARGEKIEFDDAIEWFEREANGSHYDPAISQLVMSMAAIHTTTDLVAQVLIDLASHPEMLQPVQDEMISVISQGGWKKTSLYNLKVLDSVIKETQRLKPIGLVSMRRIALREITLSDGTIIPKNTTVAASESRMWDPSVYPQPEKWDGTRFLKLREESGKEHVAQLVSTSPEHLGFGHGQHACPGRFFAANEVKIALVHLLLKYEWQLPEGVVPKVRSFGFSLGADPFLKMEYRRRETEIEL